MDRRTKFVVRTVRSGQVKINGKMFEPTNKWREYDGRFEGQRWAFGLYWCGDKQLPFVELWGTEEAYIAAHDDERWEAYCADNEITPDMVPLDEESGRWYYPWATWCTEEQEGEPWRKT